MPSWASINFQTASSPLMEQLIFFHNHTMTILVLIISIVGYSMYSTISSSLINKFMLESQQVELFWTITPTFILILIGVPSIRLLYLLDEVFNPMITLKTIGHQWYWSYEYSDFQNIEFDSYMNQYPDVLSNQFRLLDVDNRVILPINTQIRNLVSAADVLHSWTIPSLGIKVDAVPGRLNQINFSSNFSGNLYGQCSEICGANHSFMPICLEMIPSPLFINWIKSFK